MDVGSVIEKYPLIIVRQALVDGGDEAFLVHDHLLEPLELVSIDRRSSC
jgi:hypothetical protein